MGPLHFKCNLLLLLLLLKFNITITITITYYYYPSPAKDMTMYLTLVADSLTLIGLFLEVLGVDVFCKWKLMKAAEKIN